MPRDLYNASPEAQFVISNAEGLKCAAALLGGAAAQKRLCRLIDEIVMSPQPNRRIQRELDAIDDLLSLRYVHDAERIEAELFSKIHPEDPAIEDICLLLEGLRDARLLGASLG